MNRAIYLAVGVGAAGIAAVWALQPGSEMPAETAPGAPMVKVAVPPMSGTAREGEELFNANCAVCHGENAAGQEGVAPPLVHKIYEPGHHGDGSFYLAALRGVRAHHWPFGDMPPVEGVAERDMARIIAYVRTLQRENGIF
jgi:mono/diheme cytochrome c family protein